MKRLRIGISQRVDWIAGRDERRDALDQRWSQLLWSIGMLAIPLSSQTAEPDKYLTEIGLEGFILSGGNDIGESPERDRLEMALLKHACDHALPVLGVCRGLQFINYFQGGSIVPIEAHVDKRHRISGPMALGRSDVVVNSYHRAAVTQPGLGKDLEPLAYTSDGCIEALRHAKLPWLAIMWHPERESPFQTDDKQLIQTHFGVAL